MTTLYPWGYQRLLVPLDRLKQLARIDLMEPEYAQRLFAWIVSRDGHIGIGGAVRFVQPEREGFAPPGKSFHELQSMAGGKFFMAVDLVARNGSSIHRSPTWSEVPAQGSSHPDIRDYGLHCNVGGEPWHMQAIEIDGYDSWVSRGRPRPNPNFPIKGGKPDVKHYSPGERTLRVTTPRMYGIDIAYLQQTLTREGLPLDDDGYYGPKSAEAVKVIQGRNDLQRTGVVGTKTWKAIIAYNTKIIDDDRPRKHPIGSRTLKLKSPTMRGNDVLWVQNKLKEQGFRLSADSIYGKQTRNRVRIFQERHKLKNDGIVDTKTWEVFKQH